jgi:hypothetical protein
MIMVDPETGAEASSDDNGEGHELDLGVQPLDAVLTELGVTNHELVEKCGEGLTHKAMARARRGRRLTSRMKLRITQTLNALLKKREVEKQYRTRDLFNY